MTGTAEFLLGVIAAAVALMAAIQVGAIVVGLRLARRVEQLARELESDVRPLVARLSDLTAEATRAAGLATAQVERLDRLFGDVTARAEDTLASAQQLLAGPVRNGVAIVSGVRAALSAFQSLRETGRRRRAPAGTGEESEESLFIG